MLENPWTNLACLIIASIMIALLLRATIERADTPGEHLARAAWIPYLGHTLSLCLMGMTAALMSCFVVIPYGLVCQYAMSAAIRRA